MSGPVVVGVDGTVAALRAVRWAAEHARRHDAELRIAHAIERPGSDERVTRLLRTATGVAHTADLPVTTVTSRLSPAELLVRESSDASLLILGGHGHGGFTSRLIGATTLTVATRGHCPLVVMTGEPGPGPVVVGTDGTPTSDAALSFAFREAVVRETDLLIVQSSTEVPPRPDAVTAALRYWEARHPHVKVSHEIVPEVPGRALLDRTAGAQLVVVGSRNRLGYRGPILRATGQLLLHHAPCPVAVVRWDHHIAPLRTVSNVPPERDQ